MNSDLTRFVLVFECGMTALVKQHSATHVIIDGTTEDDDIRAKTKVNMGPKWNWADDWEVSYNGKLALRGGAVIMGNSEFMSMLAERDWT